MGFKLMKPMLATEPLVRMIFDKAEERNVSLMALADRVGTDFQLFQRYRRGQSIMRADRFRQLANALGYDVVLVPREDAGILRRGAKVVKRSGYGFPGVIVAKFETTAGATRYVVEATGKGYEGMLHIFDGEQIARHNPEET